MSDGNPGQATLLYSRCAHLRGGQGACRGAWRGTSRTAAALRRPLPPQVLSPQFGGRRGMDAGCRVGGWRAGRRRGAGPEARAPSPGAARAAGGVTGRRSGGGAGGRGQVMWGPCGSRWAPVGAAREDAPSWERGAQSPVRVRSAPEGAGARHPQGGQALGVKRRRRRTRSPVPAPRAPAPRGAPHGLARRPRPEGEEEPALVNSFYRI